MNMHETLRRLRRAGLIVDFNINETGSEYSVVFQPAVPNVLLAELFGRAARCTYQVDPNPVHSSYNWEEAQRLAKESGRDPRDERQFPASMQAAQGWQNGHRFNIVRRNRVSWPPNGQHQE